MREAALVGGRASIWRPLAPRVRMLQASGTFGPHMRSQRFSSTAQLIAGHPVFDAHVDSLQRQLDLGHDLGIRTTGHLDLERGRAGGLGSVVFVNWVDPKYIEDGPGAARRRTVDLLREFHVLIERHPESVRFAGNAALMAEAHRAGAVAGIPGIEGGHSIEEDLDHLQWFFAHGVRVLTLVWNNHLSWIRSCQAGAGASIPEGLSPFGREVVRTMNELGMLVDVSHAGERAFYDVLEASSKPVIASHSGCKTLYGHQRNLTDDQLHALAQNGGVVGIVFCVAFLKDEAQREDARWRESEEFRSIRGINDTDVFVKQGEFLQRQAEPLSLDTVADHIQHAVEIAGIDHVGIGSDYDGIGRTPQGLEDASCYGALAERLFERGFELDDLEKILGANMRRVFARATGVGTEACSARLERLSA
jgi:membrane dipeptidase